MEVVSSLSNEIAKIADITYPSVFFAGFSLTLPPAMSMFENTTSLELATRVYHCGLYLNFKSSMRAPSRPIAPKRMGLRM